MKKLLFTLVACFVALTANATTVFFENTAGWAKVYAYAWTPNNASWPGVVVTTTIEASGKTFYAYTIPSSQPNIIFNAGNGQPQTKDLAVVDGAVYNGSNVSSTAQMGTITGSPGNYTYTPSGVEVKSYDWYLCGSVNGWTQKDADYGFEKQADGTYTLVLDKELTSGFKIIDANITWYGSNTKVDVSSANVNATLALSTGGGDIAFSNPATTIKDAKLTLNPTTKNLTITGTTGIAQYDLYLLGAVNDWTASPTYKFETSDYNTYTLKLPSFSSNSEFKVGSDGWTISLTANSLEMKNGEYDLESGGENNNMAFAVDMTDLILTVNLKENKLTVSGTEGEEGEISYTSWWVNLAGSFNGNNFDNTYTQPDESGIATFESVAIGTDAFELKTWNTKEDAYYNSCASGNLIPGEWMVISNANMEGQFLVIEGASEGESFKVEFNCATNEIRVTPTSSSTPTYPEKLYVLGNFGTSDWDPSAAVQMTNGETEGIYTISNLNLDNGSGEAYFSFCTKPGTTNTDWAVGTRYGAGIENDVIIQSGSSYDLVKASDPQAFCGKAGTYTITVDLTTNKMTATWVETPDEPDPDVNLVPFDMTYDFNSETNVYTYWPNLPPVSSWTVDSGNKKYSVSSTTISSENTSIEFSTGTGSNPPVIYAYSGSYDVRMYANNVVTVNAPKGGTLKEIVFYCSTINTQINKMQLVAGQPGTFVNNSSAKTMTWTAPENEAISQISFTTTGNTRYDKVSITGEIPEVKEPEVPAIPEDAYVVYYNGEIGESLEPNEWWNASYNLKAENPDGEGYVYEFKPGAASTSDGSMGLMTNNYKIVGPLNSADLNVRYYAEGTGKYTIRLTGGGDFDYDFEVTAENANQWNTITFNVAEEFPTLAENWKEVNYTGNVFPFAIVVSAGENAVIYFDQIYYTNLDAEWVAPEIVIPAPESIPTPNTPADDVLAIFSNGGYTEVPGVSIPWWEGQSSQTSVKEIEGNKAYQILTFNYQGLDINPAINVSDYDYMHVDFWASEATGFGFTPITSGGSASEKSLAQNVVAESWNSYDVALSEWADAGMNLENVFQIKFDGGNGKVVAYIANVYFWKEDGEKEDVITYVLNGPTFKDGSVEMTLTDGVLTANDVDIVPQTFNIEKRVNGVMTEFWGAETDAEAANQITRYGEYQGALNSDINWVTSAATSQKLNFSFDLSTLVLTVTNAAPEMKTIYVVGSGDGLSWDLPGQAYEGTDGVVTFTVSNLTKFKVADVETTDWDTFNPAAYYTTSEFTEAVYEKGQTLPMVNNVEGADQKDQMLPWAGEYTITLNFNTKEMTTVTNTPKPTEAPAVYIRGAMNNWLNDGLSETWQFTYNESAGSYTFVCEGATTINANVEFKFADASWGSINFGCGAITLTGESTVVDLTSSGSNMTLAEQFQGTITLVISGAKATATFTKASDSKPYIPETLYIIGNVNDNNWTPSAPIAMKKLNEGDFLIANAVIDNANEGDGYFSFCTQPSSNPNSWEIGTRYGAKENDVRIEEGQSLQLYTISTEHSFMLAAGTYDIRVEFNEAGEGKVTIGVAGTLGVGGIVADDAEAEYYTIDGFKVQNPVKGIYIKVAGGKAEKVVL